MCGYSKHVQNENVPNEGAADDLGAGAFPKQREFRWSGRLIGQLLHLNAGTLQRIILHFDSVWADNRENGGCVDHREVMCYDRGQTLEQVRVEPERPGWIMHPGDQKTVGS